MKLFFCQISEPIQAYLYMLNGYFIKLQYLKIGSFSSHMNFCFELSTPDCIYTNLGVVISSDVITFTDTKVKMCTPITQDTIHYGLTEYCLLSDQLLVIFVCYMYENTYLSPLVRVWAPWHISSTNILQSLFFAFPFRPLQRKIYLCISFSSVWIISFSLPNLAFRWCNLSFLLTNLESAL